jgi:hypothetical protein
VNDHPLTLHVLNLLAAKIIMIEAAVEMSYKVKLPGGVALDALQKVLDAANIETSEAFQDRMNRIRQAEIDIGAKKSDIGLIPF